MESNALNTIGINATSLQSSDIYIQKYTRNLIIELQKLLPHPPLLFNGKHWGNEYQTSLISRGISYKKSFSYLQPLLYLIQQHYFKKGKGAKDIVLYHEPNFVSHPFSGPSILTIHDLAYIRHSESYPSYFAKFLERHVSRSVMQAQHITVSSAFVKGEIIAFYHVNPQKITIASPGTHHQFKRYAAIDCKTVLNAYNLTYGNYILTSGALEPYKNIKTLLHAFLTLKDSTRQNFPLVITGISAKQAGTLSRQMTHLIQKKQIILLDHFQPCHSPFLYSGAKLYAYPSLYEGFPWQALEAMACGTPIIASTTSSLPEVIGEAGILIRPDDIDHWSFWIQTWLDSPETLSKYSLLSQERAKSFSWQGCAQQTLLAYNSVLKPE